jgi:hypothetical protein
MFFEKWSLLLCEQKYVFNKKSCHQVEVIIDEHYVYQNTGNATTVETVKYQDSNTVSFMMRGKNLIGTLDHPFTCLG